MSTPRSTETFQVTRQIAQVAAGLMGERAAIVIVMDEDGYIAIADIAPGGARIPRDHQVTLLEAAASLTRAGKPDRFESGPYRPVRG